MIDFFKKIFASKDLRKRVIVTLILLFIVRVMAVIPIIGIDNIAFRSFFDLFSGNNKRSGESLISIIGLLSGSGMENLSIVLLGVGPYITSSIIIQVLSGVIPALENLSKEGESGRAKLNLIIKIATVPIAFLQSYSMINLLKADPAAGSFLVEIEGGKFFLAILSTVIGSLAVTWIGDLISEYGIGNVVSIIIFVGIISAIPSLFVNILEAGLRQENIPSYILFFLVSVLVLSLVIFITEAERQIPVSYAKRIRGNKMYGGSSSFLPIKVNQGGVIPIIFAISFINLPGVIAGLFYDAKTKWIRNMSEKIASSFTNSNPYYLLGYFLLVIAFSYFYGVIALQPDKLSENLQNQGGFIPGIRPGKFTQEYLTKVLNRVTLAGSIFLGLMAVLPTLVIKITNSQFLTIGGTGLIIVVGTGIEIFRYFESQLTISSYAPRKNFIR